MATNWEDQVLSSPSVELIQRFQEQLPAAVARAESPNALNQLKRAQSVPGHFSGGLKRPALVPLEGLNSAASYFASALAKLEAFITDDNESHLNAVNSQLDAALIRLPIPVVPRRESQAILEESAQFGREVTRLHQQAVAQLTGLASDIESKKTEVDQHVADSEQEIENVKNESSSAQQSVKAEADARVADLRSEVDSQKTRLDSAIQQQQEAFLADQEARSREFTSSQTKASSDLQERLASLSREAATQVEVMMKEGTEAIARLADYEEQARNIVGVTAASGVAG